MTEYKWDNKKIFKAYLNNIKKQVFNHSCYNINDLIEKDDLKDMISFSIFNFISAPSFNTNSKFKKCMYFDEEFTSKLTEDEKDVLSDILDFCLNNNFKIYKQDEDKSIESFDFMEASLRFFKNIYKPAYDELLSAINENRIYVNNKSADKHLGGTYQVGGNNYYEISGIDDVIKFLTINHEIMHGIVYNKYKNTFNNQNNLSLYREVLNILIELYSIDYAFKKHMITTDEYISNYNNIYSTNISYDIDIVYALYNLSNIHYRKDKLFIKSYINKMNNIFGSDFNINELITYPLRHYLIYLLSGLVAISIYDKYHDNPTKGVYEALNILDTIVNKDACNIFKEYDLKPIEACNKYVDKNNKLVKTKS